MKMLKKRMRGNTNTTNHARIHLCLTTSMLLSMASCSAFSAPQALASTSIAQLVQGILPHLENRETTFAITIPASGANEVGQALHAALQSDDYLNHDYSSFSESITSSLANPRTMTARLRVQYLESRAQFSYVKQKVSTILKQIIKPGMTDLQKELAIHNYIVLHTAYDTTLEDVTPYDALTRGVTVCDGYVMLTYLMLKGAGIPNRIVDGSASGIAHAWNLVRVRGLWYNLDTTWDDPVPNQPGKVNYDYFNVTDASLERDHTWNRAGLPVADTDFLKVLEKGSVGISATAKSYQSVLKTTGLYLETPQYTLNNSTQLARALSAFHGTQYTFRYPESLLQQDLSQLNLLQAYSVEYTQDKRDPGYDVVTMTFS